MKLTLFKVLLIVIAAFLMPIAKAEAKTARSSAVLASANDQIVRPDNRVILLRDFLQSYNSPLTESAHTFVAEADKNNIDWKLVAAISGVESYFGEQIPPYSYNGWGYGVYGNNVRSFYSWDDGIETVSRALRKDYMNNWGASNVYEIGAIYAADPSWAAKVTHFINLIEDFESSSSNAAISISI